MKVSILLITILFPINVLWAQPKVIAHRGYWNCDGSAQNSIASLGKAQKLGIYGSEFDVWMTSDGVPVVFHDATVEEAHTLGMTVNVWTVNSEADMKEMIDAGVDFITTDQPVLCKELVKKQNF